MPQQPVTAGTSVVNVHLFLQDSQRGSLAQRLLSPELISESVWITCALVSAPAPDELARPADRRATNIKTVMSERGSVGSSRARRFLRRW
jgi:hypothetical protein